ncbi:TenA family protein [Acerihabitans arboris]|uniref:Aminopyrimidine aminohydrolase n=1 Tax=Acerihabitans arboris TaxID=2691583 RepID=A0A845SP50_9GAMM|nr:TenA family protein [Acerihabitans arboris]NDL65152.1 TenA family transcriptional regulator [Acerihabitans arboris]
MASFTEQLLAEHQATWRAMQQHRFVTDIEQDKLPDRVFNQYLVFEGDFVATAIGIFALAVSKAPGIRQQRWLVGVLNALVDEQMGYFEEVLARRKIDVNDYRRDLPAVGRFRDGMLAAAQQGGYADIITLMFGAEWMYYTWCRRVSESAQADGDLRHWVDMHAAEEFFAQARWLKEELDACAAAMADDERRRLSVLYRRVLEWEIDFHGAAYTE